jgi:FkbM family methyltransferase
MEQQDGRFELLASALKSPTLQIAHFDKDTIEPISLQQLELLWNELRASDTGKPEGASFSNILVYPNKASASILNYSRFYSQNFEDVLLARCFSDVDKGFYIDVGAQDHEADSVTLYFYERGWSGINIEPVAEFAESFKCRDRDTTICCAAGSDDMIMPMTISLDSGLSSLKPKNSPKSNQPGIDLAQRNIQVRRLNSILEDLGISDKTFEFLKIDVEGHEVEVLKGIDLTHYRPQVILCEVTEPNSLIITDTFSDICLIIESQGYKKLYFDGLNQWWCVSERFDVLAERFKRPPGVFDSVLISPYAGTSACKKVVELSESLEAATQKLDFANQKLHAVAQKLDHIYASRGWKLIENMRKTWRSIRH